METIEAFADETVFRNDENGYTVLVVKAGKSRVSAVGVMPPVTSGEKAPHHRRMDGAPGLRPSNQGAEP